MIRYEYWAHRGGEKYLIRLDDTDGITGVCGPLPQTNIPTANRPNYNYDSQPLQTAWIWKHTTEFHRVELDV